MAYFRKRNGNWEYRISYKSIDGKFKQKSKSGFRTKAEAQNAAMKAEMSISTLKIDDNISFSEYFDKWKDTYKSNIRKSTLVGYNTTSNIIKRYFGQTKIKDITSTVYQEFINKLCETYYQKTIVSLNGRIRSCAKHAIADKLIDYNFTELTTINAKNKSRPEEEKFLQIDEYERLLSILEKDITKKGYMQLYLIAVTGVRVGESQGLTWKDIDFENKIIEINKTLDDMSKDKQTFSETKNKNSVRTIPASKKLLKLLSVFKKETWESNDSEIIFYKTNRYSLNLKLKSLANRNIHLHSLRHTFASYALSNGIDIVTVSSILGHSDVTITLQVYTHLLDDKKQKDFDKIRKLF